MRNKNLYQPSGYLDFEQVVDDDAPFAFVIGGRGTGKTFGALDYCKRHFDRTGKPFIYMRRSKAQAELVATSIFNPFRPLNDMYDWTVEPFPISKGVSGFYNSERDDDGRLHPVGNHVGIIAALSTFSNFRGFDGSNIDIIVYDEFIKNKGEKTIRDEGFALANVFETVNRNREIMGGTPVKLICLSNANEISNDIFIDLNLVHYVEFMRKKGRNQYYDYGRGIAIYDLADSEISQKKRNTALYRMDAGGAYTDMAIGNQYEDYDTTQVSSRPLAEYKPLVRFGEITVYQHKSDNTYYGSFHASGTCHEYKVSDIERSRFCRRYSFLWAAYLGQRIFFESFSCKRVFESIFI